MIDVHFVFTSIKCQSDSRSFKWLVNHPRRQFILPNLSNPIYQIFLSYSCLSIFLIYTVFSVPLLQLILEWLANGYIYRLEISCKSTGIILIFVLHSLILFFSISIFCIDSLSITSIMSLFNTKWEYFLKASLIHFSLLSLLFYILGCISKYLFYPLLKKFYGVFSQLYYLVDL